MYRNNILGIGAFIISCAHACPWYMGESVEGGQEGEQVLVMLLSCYSLHKTFFHLCPFKLSHNPEYVCRWDLIGAASPQAAQEWRPVNDTRITLQQVVEEKKGLFNCLTDREAIDSVHWKVIRLNLK